MTTIAQVSAAIQPMLTTAAEAADAEPHYTKRPDKAKFTANTLVQTLALGWLAHPDATVEHLAQTATGVGVDGDADQVQPIGVLDYVRTLGNVEQ